MNKLLLLCCLPSQWGGGNHAGNQVWYEEHIERSILPTHRHVDMTSCILASASDSACLKLPNKVNGPTC